MEERLPLPAGMTTNSNVSSEEVVDYSAMDRDQLIRELKKSKNLVRYLDVKFHKVEQLKGKIDEQDAEIQSLRNKLQSEQSRVQIEHNSGQSEAQELHSKLQRAQTDIGTLRELLQHSRSENSQIRGQLEKKDTDMDRLRKEIGTLKEQLARSQNSVTMTEQQKRQQQEQMAAIVGDVEAKFGNQIRNQENLVKQLTEETAQLRQTATTQGQTLGQLEQENQRLKRLLSQQGGGSSSPNAHTDEVGKLQEALAHSQVENSKLHQQMASMSQTQIQLQKQLEASRVGAATGNNQQNQSLIAEIERLRTTLGSREYDLQIQQQRIQHLSSELAVSTQGQAVPDLSHQQKNIYEAAARAVAGSSESEQEEMRQLRWQSEHLHQQLDRMKSELEAKNGDVEYQRKRVELLEQEIVSVRQQQHVPPTPPHSSRDDSSSTSTGRVTSDLVQALQRQCIHLQNELNKSQQGFLGQQEQFQSEKNDLIRMIHELQSQLTTAASAPPRVSSVPPHFLPDLATLPPQQPPPLTSLIPPQSDQKDSKSSRRSNTPGLYRSSTPSLLRKQKKSEKKKRAKEAEMEAAFEARAREMKMENAELLDAVEGYQMELAHLHSQLIDAKSKLSKLNATVQYQHEEQVPVERLVPSNFISVPPMLASLPPPKSHSASLPASLSLALRELNHHRPTPHKNNPPATLSLPRTLPLLPTPSRRIPVVPITLDSRAKKELFFC